MNLQDQVRLHKELSKKIEELELQKKALGVAILQQMIAKTLSFPGLVVRRCNRLSIKLTVEEARSLNAVKWEEIVDKDKIRAFTTTGIPLKVSAKLNISRFQQPLKFDSIIVLIR